MLPKVHGWKTIYVFEAWFKDVFLNYVADLPKPIVVFFDGHGSHITFDTAHKAKEANLHIVCLPPHTSSTLQPLDVRVYGPAKKFGIKFCKSITGSQGNKLCQSQHF